MEGHGTESLGYLLYYLMLHRGKVSPHNQPEPLLFQFIPTTSHSPAMHQCKGPGSASSRSCLLALAVCQGTGRCSFISPMSLLNVT